MPYPADGLFLAHRYLPGATLATVGGELDMATATRLEDFLHRCRNPGDHLLLDLTDLAFMDCTGVRVVVDAHRRIRREGVTLRLAALQSVPARIMKITGVDACIPVHPTLEQAVSVVLRLTRTDRRSPGGAGAATG